MSRVGVLSRLHIAVGNLATYICLRQSFVAISFERCRYFLAHVACRNLPWQGLFIDMCSAKGYDFRVNLVCNKAVWLVQSGQQLGIILGRNLPFRHLLLFFSYGWGREGGSLGEKGQEVGKERAEPPPPPPPHFS